MNSMPRFVCRVGGWLAAIALVGCAQAPSVRVDQDQRVKLTDYQSFGWYATAKPAAPDAVVDPAANAATTSAAPPTSLMDDRLHTAIASALTAKGYVANLESPQIRVSVTLNTAERPKQSGMRLGVGAGGGSGNVSGGVGLSIPLGKRNESVAFMSIDMIDSARNTQVWTGSFQQRTKKPDIDENEITAMVNTILSRFPSRQ
jgi:hypothetical protein